MTLVVALPNWIGDVVMATPTVRAVRARFPEERIVLLGRPYVRPVIEPNPWTDAFIEMPKSATGLWRAARSARRERAAAGLLLANSLRAALALWAGGAARRIGYDRQGRGPLLTDRLPPDAEAGRFVPVSQITYYLRLAAVLGAPTDDVRMELFPTASDESAAAAAYEALGLDAGRTLLLAPGAAFGPSKRWPAPCWARLVAVAREELGLQAAVLCGPTEAGEAEAILAEARGRCATFHRSGITPASARAVVRRARAMVAVDSGLRHYAAALGRPVVALFGPTDIRWTETWYPKEVRVQGVVPCGPCQEGVCRLGTTECMWRITPEEVLEALAEALRRDSASPCVAGFRGPGQGPTREP
jgi:heptosyltransferase-2